MIPCPSLNFAINAVLLSLISCRYSVAIFYIVTVQCHKGTDGAIKLDRPGSSSTCIVTIVWIQDAQFTVMMKNEPTKSIFAVFVSACTLCVCTDWGCLVFYCHTLHLRMKNRQKQLVGPVMDAQPISCNEQQCVAVVSSTGIIAALTRNTGEISYCCRNCAFLIVPVWRQTLPSHESPGTLLAVDDCTLVYNFIWFVDIVGFSAEGRHVRAMRQTNGSVVWHATSRYENVQCNNRTKHSMSLKSLPLLKHMAYCHRCNSKDYWIVQSFI